MPRYENEMWVGAGEGNVRDASGNVRETRATTLLLELLGLPDSSGVTELGPYTLLLMVLFEPGPFLHCLRNRIRNRS